MSTRVFGLQVTVHISQHFHHTEVMEEADNELEKKASCELIHVDLRSTGLSVTPTKS